MDLTCVVMCLDTCGPVGLHADCPVCERTFGGHEVRDMKTKIRDFAIFGGHPTFEEPLHVGRPNVGNREQLLRRMAEILDRRWLTNYGPCVQEFEAALADLLGVKYCCVVCNATVGLQIASRALGLTGEVIVPAFTFVATAHALQWLGITPVFCDISPTSRNLDPDKVEELITPRTTGVLGVHLWGRPCCIEELTEIAHRHRLKLLFDAAHAFACSWNGQMIGNFGEAEVFSFHATKFFNTFEGGAIVTNNDALGTKLQLIKRFGFTEADYVACLGINGKMSEISAAMGLTGLESLSEFVQVNWRNYRAYREGLSDLPGVYLFKHLESEKCNYQYVVLEIDETVTGISRDQFKDILWAENVLVRRYFYPGCHRMEPYRSLFPQVGARLPVTETLASRVLVLPTGTAVGLEQISLICDLIRSIMAQRRELSTQMQDSMHAAAFHNSPSPLLSPGLRPVYGEPAA